MNKNVKIIAWIAVGVLLSAGGVFLYLTYGPKKGIESVLPADAVVFARLQYPAKYWQIGTKSEFWNTIAAIDVPQLLEHNLITQQKIEQIDLLKKNVAAFFQSPITQKFLEKEIAVAIYRHKDISVVKNLDEAYGALLAIRLPVSMQLLALTSQVLNDWSKEIHTAQEIYKGRKITHVQIKDKNIRFKYVLLGDILIVSSETEVNLVNAIDVVLKQQKSLSADEHFQFAQAHAYEKSESVAFIDVEYFVRAFVDEGQANTMDRLGFDTYVFSFQPGLVNKYKFLLGYKPQLLSDTFAKMAACQPQNNDSLALIPPSAISYQWNACYDLGDLWGQIKGKADDMENDGQMFRFKRGIEKRFGANFSADIKSILGKEVGGYLTDIDTLGMFPYPRLLFFVKTNARSKTQELITKILGGYAELVHEEKYQGEDIHYLNLPIGANMDPGYSFVGDYLLVSSSRQLIKKSIDTFHKPETSLRKVKNFESLNWSFQERPHSMTYVKVGEFSKRLRDIFGWISKYLSTQVTSALTYEQEGNQKKLDLANDLASKEEEFKQSEVKLKELRSKDLSVLSVEEQDMQEANMKNIELDQSNLKQDIMDVRNQIQDIDKQMANVHLQAKNARVMMYNSEHVVVPVLKGLESFNALGISISVKNHVFETELLVN